MKLFLITVLVLSGITTHAATVTTLAGTGTKGFSGDGGQADKASLNMPYELAWDQAGIEVVRR